MSTTLRIATRTSQLALEQANIIKQLLLQYHPNIIVELIPLVTQGDKILDRSLEKIGGKSLFTKELECALLNNRADIAVHSMKDVPHELPEKLIISSICKRLDPSDALIANDYNTLNDLPHNAKIGTSSLRRQSQLLAQRPDLKITLLRGNVDTRLKKLDAKQYDAIILATAGLQRLQLTKRIKQRLPIDIMLPAIGQGAIGIECHKDHNDIHQLLKPLRDDNATTCILAERAMNRMLGGSCHVPIGGYAQLTNKQLTLIGLVAKLDGSLVIRDQITGPSQQAETLGTELANRLLQQGAKQILEELK